MKKSLIALAALATVATAAQAQSSVTVYGVMDAGIIHTSNAVAAGTQTSFQSGALASPRWGVRGTEDLGGGLSAGFNLESEVNMGTGVGGSTNVVLNGTQVSTPTLFNRASVVSLTKNDLGTVTLGRMNRLEYDAVVAYDVFGGANIAGSTRAGYLAAGVVPNVDARVNNAVKLTTAKIAGIEAQYQHVFGGVAGDASAWKTDAFRLSYSNGPLSVSFTSAQNDNATVKVDSTRTAFASYDFGILKVSGGSAQKKIDATGVKVSSDHIGVAYPVGAKTTLLANYIHIKNEGGAAGAKADTVGVGALYALSKRTTAYAIYATTNNNATANAYNASTATTSIGTIGTGYDPKSVAIGVRHTF